MKMKESAQQITLNLFQNCDFPEELSEAFNAEVVLNDHAVGRSRYDRFHCVRRNYAREKRSNLTRSREPSRVPLKELSRVFKKSKKIRLLTREHISKIIPKSQKNSRLYPSSCTS